MKTNTAIATVSVTYAADGSSVVKNAMGMRAMQERVWSRRGERHLLVKSPPASGKSRALMYVALDKLTHQGVKQAIIAVPERTIGASFYDADLTANGFWADWRVDPRWNLCDAPGTDDGGKVRAVGEFLRSDGKVLVCTHATFRFAVDEYGIEAFDDRLIAIDEFHHVSADTDSNRLGAQLHALLERDRIHTVAMTGSYFRGDSVPVLHADDEQRFETVTYTYYEQLNGYRWLKHLDIGYCFYGASYLDELMRVLDPTQKTILHIPSVNSRESTKDKLKEVEAIFGKLGKWLQTDPDTGFQLIETKDGRVLRVADLVDDDPARRDKVASALRDPAQKDNRDWVDIIIALGMAKEGFDWIWCEHALTIGYRASLTEVVQIIGRATRDAPGKTHARFTNLIAEPDASEEKVTEAVNDTLKAVAASLLMEQVLTPKYDFRPKALDGGGAGEPEQPAEPGRPVIEIKGLKPLGSKEAERIAREDIEDIAAKVMQDKDLMAQALFNPEVPPQETTQVKIGAIVQEHRPDLSEEDAEAIRQRVVAAMYVAQRGGETPPPADTSPTPPTEPEPGRKRSSEPPANTAFVDGTKRYDLDVRELDIDLIDAVNPFGAAYAILAKTMDEGRLRQVAEVIAARKAKFTPAQAKELAKRAAAFKKARGRPPEVTSTDPWEAEMARGAAAFMRYHKEGAYADRN